jgi:hypothetical protein
MPYSPGTGALQSYQAVIQKEDVSELIGLISPEDTPLYSAFRSESCHQKIVHWQEDALRAPAVNRQVEGVDAVTVTAGAPGTGSLTATLGPSAGVAGLTTDKSNYTQIFAETAQTSSTVDNTEVYGRANDHDYQVMKKGLELKRDIEYAFLLGQAGTAGNSTTARQLTSVDGLIASTARLSAGTAAPLTEADILTLHKTVYALGGEPNVLMVSPAHSMIVADFAYRVGGATPFTSVRGRDVAGGTEIVNVVELYRDPFGTLSVQINKYMTAAGAAKSSYDVYLLQMDAWWVPTLQPIMSENLAKVGLNRRTLLSTELTLAHLNGECSGRLYNLSATGA